MRSLSFERGVLANEVADVPPCAWAVTVELELPSVFAEVPDADGIAATFKSSLNTLHALEAPG